MNIEKLLPAGPKKPKILQFINFLKDPTTMLSKYHNIYGHTFTLRFPGQPPYVIITDPDDIKSIFMETSGNINAGEINGTVLKPVLGNFSLLTLDGERHMFHRKLMLPPFHGERMRSYGEIMQNITLSKISNWNENDTLSIFQEISDITFDIILHAIFGIEEGSRNYIKLKTLLLELLHTIKTPFGLATLILKKLHVNLGFLTPWSKIQRLKIEVDHMLYDEIESRRNSKSELGVDVLSMLMQAKDENGDAMSNQEIRDEMLTLLIAGHETSATAVAWSIYYILSNKNVLDKLLLEIDGARAEYKEQDKFITKLPYMDMVIKESLRMTPVVPYIARLTTTEYKLKCGATIPKGVALVPSIYLTHNDSLNWSSPEKFIPERFETSQDKPYAFLPFGGGTRRCIGAAFAMYEIKTILSTILATKKMKLVDGYVPTLIRKGVVIAPSEGVPVIIKQ